MRNPVSRGLPFEKRIVKETCNLGEGTKEAPSRKVLFFSDKNFDWGLAVKKRMVDKFVVQC